MIAVTPLAINHGQFPQDEAANARAADLLADTTKNLYGVYRYYDRFQSRPFVSSRQITLATGGAHPCLRFTDAAVLYFWPYRKRPKRSPIDTDFNLGIRRAQSDLDDCPWLLGYLVDIENQLVAAGELHRENKRIIKPAEFCRAECLVQFEQFKLWSGSVIDELWTKGEIAKSYRASFTESVEQLQKVFESVDRKFFTK